MALLVLLLLVPGAALAQTPEDHSAHHPEELPPGVVATENTAPDPNADPETIATAFWSETCGMCLDYIVGELAPALGEGGIKTLQVKEFFNNLQNRAELVALVESAKIPQEIRGHILTKVGERLYLMGHVPIPVVKELLDPATPRPYERIVVYQDSMHGEGKTYKAWDFKGPIMEYPVNSSITTYLKDLDPQAAPVETGPARSLLPVVLTSGLLDGINPCAFAVMGFLVAFLFAIRRQRSHIIAIGAVFIIAIFLTYFLLGVGLLRGFRIPGPSHIVGTVGAYLTIALGLSSIKDYFWPSFPLRFSMPKPSWELTRSWIQKATLPATVVAGVLTGLCTLPCSGAIYVAILGLLTARTTYGTGLAYLGLYNLMYILPLILILGLTTNRVTARGLATWERGHARVFKLLFGVAMIVLGIAILVWWL